MGLLESVTLPIIGGMRKVFITADEARDRLGFKHVQSVYDAIKDGRLEGFKDDRRMWWVSEESVERFTRRKRGNQPKQS